jgi:hypothetical protein
VSLIQVSTNSVSAVSFSALVKAGISYQLTGRFRLFGNIGFCDLKPTFKNTTVMVFEADGLVVPGIYSLNNSISAVSANSHTFNYIQPMNSIDLSVDIRMRL